MPKFETVIFEKKGHTALVTMNRPERLNAYNEQLHADLGEAWMEANRDEDVWTVVVTGAGRAFCTGADVREASAHMSKGQLGAPRWELNVDFLRNYNEQASRRMLGVVGYARSPVGLPAKPIIAAVNTICAGDGLGFVYNCDFVICSDDATFFDPHVNVAVSPPGIISMPRLIPRSVGFATMMLGLNYRMPAKRAYEIGLVTEVVPLSQLVERALELAEEINAWSAPTATKATKAAFWTTWGHGYEAARPWTQVFDNRVRFETEDFQEGRKAFAAKRRPVWKAK